MEHLTIATKTKTHAHQNTPSAHHMRTKDYPNPVKIMKASIAAIYNGTTVTGH